MNGSLSFRDGIGFFPDLLSLGIKNAFTYDNQLWGTFRRLQQTGWGNYKKLMTTAGIDSDTLGILGVENNDGIQMITTANWEVYQHFAKRDEINKGQPLTATVVSTDGIITDQPIPLLLAPADCAGIVITGIDTQTSKRFLIFLHSGLYGMQLGIIKKSLQQAHLVYTFAHADLQAFVFPHITGAHYKHPKATWKHHDFLDIEEWQPYFLDYDDKWGIDFSSKIFHELQAQGISKVFDSGLDTYIENKEGRLFSQTYNREHNPDGLLQRFGIVVQLNQ